MQEEPTALDANHTWQITTLSPEKTTIGYHWVYKIKHKSDGSIDRYKACLVAKGYTQLKGHDFIDTFALVSKLTTLCLILVLLLPMIEFSNNSMSITFFYIETSLRKCIFSHHLASLSPHQTTSTNSKDLSMVFIKLADNGMPNYITSYFHIITQCHLLIICYF